MRYANSVVDLVGDTPLVKLNRVTEGVRATILVKVEYLNPGGSSKDRIATRIIDAAEASGDLRPGGTIVEPTSGNTGVGLRAGLRWQVPNLPIQLIPEVRYLDVLDDSLTSFRVTGLFTIAPRVDLVAGLQTGDDDRLELGARYNF